MLPDLGFVEILTVGAIALIVVGPKDFPRLMRDLGRGVGRVRAMAREFQIQLDAAARAAEVDSLRDEVRRLRDDADPTREAQKALNEAEQAWRSPSQTKNSDAAEPPKNHDG